MRLGGPIEGNISDPALWVAALRKAGYRAAYAPVGPEADDATIAAVRKVAADADIVIAETGAWSNPMSSDVATRAAALDKCKSNLLLAERIGARCCVNICGSRGTLWDGPHPKNLTDETFQMIVDVTREIIDAVVPKHSFYTLETMPWMYPDSTESYAALLKAIDRKQFGVHFDPVNLICSPQRYFGNGALIKEFIDKLGPSIKSCHAKDIILREQLTTHLDEAIPGEGFLDYPAMLRNLNRLNPDLPLMLEHLPAERYPKAASNVRKIAKEEGVSL
jgi:sugar phosphate isomerase/epimerase